MQNAKSFLKEHALAFGLAVVLALVSIFPQVMFRVDHRDVYQGIELLPDSPWSARVREVQDGHASFGSIYYKEGKDDPYLFQPLGSIAVGKLGDAFNLDINNTLLLARVVFSILAFLLLYAFVLVFSRDKRAALVSASILLFADSVLSYYGVSQMFHGLSPDSFLRLSRPVYPALIYISLFSFLTVFWQFYKKQNWRWGVAAAILLALNFYTYFYSWTFLYAAGGILGLLLLVTKQFKQALRVAVVYVGALLLAIPFILNLHRASTFATYAETSLRFGVINTHAPSLIGITALVALIAFIFLYPRERKDEYLAGLALLIAPVITLNQQLLTGKVLQPAHYHWFFHKPFALIFITIIIFHLLDKKGWSKFAKVLTVLGIIASVFVGAFVQSASYASDSRDGGSIAIERQKYGPVTQWLNQHAEGELVVFGNDETSHMVVIYTPHNVFYHRAAIYSLAATDERLRDVLFTFYRLRGIDTKTVKDVFYAERGFISTSIYGMHYRELLGSYEAISDDKIDELLREYTNTLSVPRAEWLKQVFAKYDVDYLVWDTKKDPDWKLDQYSFLKKEAEFGDMLIYSTN